MKSSLAALALCSAMATSAAVAQTQPSSFGAIQPKSPYGNLTPAPAGSEVLQSGSRTPDLTPANELRPPTIDLPHEPIEPYLLSKENGPFMVLARVFRGVDAERMALALVKELRNEYKLPAYILRTKDFPGKSLMRGTPPTVPSNVMKPDIKMPEKIRTFDEAAVVVGNEKTTADQEKLWRQVKKIKPKCLNGMANLFPWREGLSHAIRTTNPYVPAQNLYPRTKDRLIVQMNTGLRSIINCPGRYSLQIAEFSGRTTFGSQPGGFLPDLHESPLQTAHADAEKMADKLAKDAEFQRLGQPVYVLHDRTASRVYIGSFDSPEDPRARAVRERLMMMAIPLQDKSRRGRNALDTTIVPALALTDLNVMKTKVQN